MNHSNPSRDQQRSQLAAWLSERNLDVCLREDVEAVPVRRTVRYDAPKEIVRVGDVRILCPTSGSWGPVYVLIMEVAGPHRWLVAPFGRYAHAAVPGEWETGLRDIPLRVVCFWNVRTSSVGDLLPGSAKRFSSAKMNLAHSAYRAVCCGETRDPDAGRFGPPLVHPADPRHEYLDEERQRLDEHCPVVDESIIPFDAVAHERAAWRIAAEGRAIYDP